MNEIKERRIWAIEKRKNGKEEKRGLKLESREYKLERQRIWIVERIALKTKEEWNCKEKWNISIEDKREIWL